MAGAKPVTLRLGAASYATPTWAKVLEMASRAMLDGSAALRAALLRALAELDGAKGGDA